MKTTLSRADFAIVQAETCVEALEIANKCLDPETGKVIAIHNAERPEVRARLLEIAQLDVAAIAVVDLPLSQLLDDAGCPFRTGDLVFESQTSNRILHTPVCWYAGGRERYRGDPHGETIRYGFVTQGMRDRMIRNELDFV